MTDTPTPNATPTRASKPSLSERIRTIAAAWLMLAPDSRFGGFTLAEFGAATEPSQDWRETIASLNLRKKAAVADKGQADAITRLLVRRLVAAVAADPAFGPNAPLYRAMGYVPKSERKSPRLAATSGAPSGSNRSVSLMERLGMIKAAWLQIDSQTKLGGLSLADFAQAAQPSADARAAIANTNAARKKAIGDRNAADAVSLRALNQVVAGVKADPAFGRDCALYRAMGFVLQRERKSPTRADS